MKNVFKELDPQELDKVIRGLRWIMKNPDRINEQQMFTENFHILFKGISQLDEMGIYSSNIVEKLEQILTLLEECATYGYFSDYKGLNKTMETISSYLVNVTNYRKKENSTVNELNRRGYPLTPEQKKQEYQQGYEETLSKIKSGNWTLFDEAQLEGKGVYYKAGAEDAELKVLGRDGSPPHGRSFEENLDAILLDQVLKMSKEKKLLESKQIENLLRYKADKGEDIEELSQELLSKSSARNKLDQLLENLATGLVLKETKRMSK